MMIIKDNLMDENNIFIYFKKENIKVNILTLKELIRDTLENCIFSDSFLKLQIRNIYFYIETNEDNSLYYKELSYPQKEYELLFSFYADIFYHDFITNCYNYKYTIYFPRLKVSDDSFEEFKNKFFFNFETAIKNGEYECF